MGPCLGVGPYLGVGTYLGYLHRILTCTMYMYSVPLVLFLPQAIKVSPMRQLAVVADLLLMHKPRRAIVFTPTKCMYMYLLLYEYTHVHVDVVLYSREGKKIHQIC